MIQQSSYCISFKSSRGFHFCHCPGHISVVTAGSAAMTERGMLGSVKCGFSWPRNRSVICVSHTILKHLEKPLALLKCNSDSFSLLQLDIVRSWCTPSLSVQCLLKREIRCNLPRLCTQRCAYSDVRERFTDLLGLVRFASIFNMDREVNYVYYSSCVVSPRKTPKPFYLKHPLNSG